MDIADLDYELPPSLIAQQPAARRDASRLLVYDRAAQQVRHRSFAELPDELGSDHLVVVNDTRVVPARIPIATPRGEVLLVERLDGDVWEGLARPTRRLRPHRRYGAVELLEHLGEGRWRLRLHGDPHGETPLPPYITEPLADPARYQTVYARDEGSAAAPTAGLHFTPELLARPEVEVVGVAEDDRRSERAQLVGVDALDCSFCAHGHERGRGDVAVRGVKDAGARCAVGCGDRERTHRTNIASPNE